MVHEEARETALWTNLLLERKQPMDWKVEIARCFQKPEARRKPIGSAQEKASPLGLL